MTSRFACKLSLLALLISPLLVASGCDKGPELAPVTGVVLLDGKPLPNATIEFQPDDGSPSFATTGEDGSYELMFTRDRKGAMPGKHRISIRTEGNVVDADGSERKVREMLPAKYHDKTELVRDITAGENIIEFRLESDPKLARRAGR